MMHDVPIVIAHRGASGYRPEHTLAAYELAIEMGADYIEPDIVATRDGVLVVRHENEISGTTDVAAHPAFTSRHTTKVIDGARVSGWFVEDFTLAELKTLRAKERLPELRPRNTTHDGRYEVPTLQQVIDLVRSTEARVGRRIGIYPETKHPSYFESIGLALEGRLIELLRENAYEDEHAPVFIQSFETTSLRKLSTMTHLPLIQLLDAGARASNLVSPAGLGGIARYAAGIGVHKDLIVPRDAEARLLAPTTLIHDAHAAGLLVHAWTFRNENEFLPADFRRGGPAGSDLAGQHGDAEAEIALFLRLGLDGFFIDFPDTGVAARDAWLASR
jgi:glycerophosphoryl diester phosphodiesterase